jgi:hypothetical protein
MRMHRWKARGSRLIGLLALMAGAAFAQEPPVVQLQYSADMGANIVGVSQFAARRDYVIDDTLGTRLHVAIPGLPDTVNLNDFQIDTSNALLFTLDTGVSLGSTFYRAGDVIAYAGGEFSKAFDATAAGVPRGVICDGVARSGTTGALLLSFDRGFAVGGVVVRPADVIAQSGAGFGAKLLDARALGLRANLNVDAIDALGTTSDLLLSFDSGGAVAGVVFADEDILQLHLATSAWSKRFTLLAFSSRWGTANLDGLAAAANGDALFSNGFE